MQSCCVDSVMGGMEPECRAHLRWEVMRAAPFPARCAGATWRLSVVRLRKTTEPPAHCRLVSDHDLFEIVALLDCTVPMTGRLDRGGESDAAVRVIPLVGRGLRHSSGADMQSHVRARPRGSRPAIRPPALRVALTGADRGARELFAKRDRCLAAVFDVATIVTRRDEAR
jgi:hypothetical protein